MMIEEFCVDCYKTYFAGKELTILGNLYTFVSAKEDTIKTKWDEEPIACIWVEVVNKLGIMEYFAFTDEQCLQLKRVTN